MLLVKKFVNTNSRGVKIILMSATLDVDKLRS
jgi:HrpA-like RNA helicase